LCTGKQTLRKILFKPHLASSAASRKPNGVFSFKQEMSERKAVKFYRSYWEVAMELNDKDRLAFYDALMLRQFTGEQTILKGMAKFAYISQKHSIDAQVKGFEDKTKIPLQPPYVGGTQPPLVQEEEKEKEEYTKLKFSFLSALLDYGFDEGLSKEWMQVRKDKKATNTETAFKSFIAQVEKNGKDKNFILRTCVEKSWKGFDSSWLKNQFNLPPQIID
jgi:hypothetical protein